MLWKKTLLRRKALNHIQDILKACWDVFINDDLGSRYENVRLWSMSVDGLRRHWLEWVGTSASQHGVNVGFYVAIICYEEWNDWFNPDLNWPGTSDAWWHFFLSCSMANVLWLRTTERHRNILVFYLVGKTPSWNMCYVFRLLTAVSCFTGGTDMFIESYS